MLDGLILGLELLGGDSRLVALRINFHVSPTLHTELLDYVEVIGATVEAVRIVRPGVADAGRVGA